MSETSEPGGALKSAADALKSIGELIKPFSDPTLGELGAYVAEKIRYLRFKNSVRTLQKATAFLAAQGLEPKPIPTKLLVSILEEVGLEDDSDLVERWAQLLAAGSAGSRIPQAYVSILRDLTSLEARMIEVIHERANDESERHGFPQTSPVPMLDLAAWYERNRPEDIGVSGLVVALENLARLRLIYTGMEFMGPASSVGLHGQVLLTSLGSEFVKACRGPRVSRENGATGNPGK